MNVIPAGREAQIQFARTHAQAWEVDPAAIGLTPQIVDAIADAAAASETRGMPL